MVDLSDNQQRLMAAIRDTDPAWQTTEQLGAVRDRDRQQLGADAARKAMGRLESRDLAEGEGNGKARRWWLTAAGLDAINELRPPKSEVESGAEGRTYTVLEQTTLHTLMERCAVGDVLEDLAAIFEELEDQQVFVIAGVVTARNTEHAFRQVGKDVYGRRDYDDDVVSVPSVAVDGKRWKVVPVNVKAEPTVTIG